MGAAKGLSSDSDNALLILAECRLMAHRVILLRYRIWQLSGSKRTSGKTESQDTKAHFVDRVRQSASSKTAVCLSSRQNLAINFSKFALNIFL
jgi:hypothetical protein